MTRLSITMHRSRCPHHHHAIHRQRFASANLQRIASYYLFNRNHFHSAIADASRGTWREFCCKRSTASQAERCCHDCKLVRSAARTRASTANRSTTHRDRAAYSIHHWQRRLPAPRPRASPCVASRFSMRTSTAKEHGPWPQECHQPDAVHANRNNCTCSAAMPVHSRLSRSRARAASRYPSMHLRWQFESVAVAPAPSAHVRDAN